MTAMGLTPRPATRTGPAAVGLLTLLAALTSWPAHAQRAEAPVSYSRNRVFDVPFTFDSNADPKQVRLVHLYLRRDGGRWVFQSSVGPGQKRFNVRVDADGGYDLAVRAEFLGGGFQPARVDDLQPAQRVLVDTVAPTVTLRALPPGRELGVEWDVRDELLDPSTLTLEYRAPGKDWGFLEAEPRARGIYSWAAQPNTRLEMRLRVRDRANNQGEAVVTVSNVPGDGGGAAPPPAPPGLGEPPPGGPVAGGRPEVYYVNSKQITLRSKVKTKGPSGVAGVDLYWCKPDARIRDWKRVEQAGGDGLPQDDVVTLSFTAEGEGRYGFRMVARSGVGLTDGAPQPRDEPQVLVEVDLTPPEVRDLQVTVNPNQPRKLTITWEVIDGGPSSGGALIEDPITLEYAPENKKDADWKPIVLRYRNTSRVEWEAPEGKPYKFFVRLSTADKAQNTASRVSKEVTIDLVKPTVEIDEVVPIRPDPPQPKK
jgi:hypothetical protein